MASVLIVDDEEIIANSIARALGTTDHTVNKFYNGTDALTFLRDNTVDVAILDLLMNDISGEEILEWLSKNSPNTKPVIMTAYLSDDTKRNLLQKGARMVLAKPFDDILAFPTILRELLNP